MRAIVAAVQRPSVSDAEFNASLTELRQLAKTLGFEVVATFTQKRAGFDAAAYFGTGKREELKEKVLESGAKLILIDHEISPSQAFNLAKEVGAEVLDRTMVILEIFHRHASSKFARAQVEIARLGYMGPRLREAAKQAGPKDRARSGTGGRSGGESHGELDRRKIRDRIAELQGDLDAMIAERKTQRARRQ
ncbi:MAG TPA: GTPase HflX, partial [Burkholderiales bacterium]|nr:GTPase HflX [Burkholderiales bacterium]